MGIATHGAAQAALEVNTRWDSRYRADQTVVPDGEHEIPRLKHAAGNSVSWRQATPVDSIRGRPELGLAYKLSLDGARYYLQPARFMARSRPDEVCTPTPFANTPTYRCDEGQRLTKGCHLFVFDADFKEVGYYSLNIRETFSLYCNAVPAVGVGDKQANELLVTVQYFDVDGTAARSAPEIGSGWRRMTLRVKLTAKDGWVSLEQDDRCLGNPNRIESVPEARAKLRRCAASLAK